MNSKTDTKFFNIIIAILSIISITLNFVCFGPKIYICLRRTFCLKPGSRQNNIVGDEEGEEAGQRNRTGRVLFKVTDSHLEDIS
jgi:hypothetical protein